MRFGVVPGADLRVVARHSTLSTRSRLNRLLRISLRIHHHKPHYFN